MSIWHQVWGSIWGGWRTHGPGLGGDDGALASGDPFHVESVTAENALKLSAVWACVGLRADTIASLPLHLRRDREIDRDHPLYRVLHDSPNADMTASEFWAMQSACVDLLGNAFSRVVRNGDRVISLEPLDPQAVSIVRKKSGAIVYQTTKDEYPDTEILHLKGFSRDGLVGMSALEFGREIIGGQLEANDAAFRAFRQGLKTGGFLKTGAQTLTPEQRAGLRKALGEFGKTENAGKWMILEAGMEPVGGESVRIKPADAELLASRYFGIEEVCRVFRVPPPLIGHTDKASSWASSLENMNLGFLTYSLRPTLVRFEQAITKRLLTPAERKTLRPKFSVEGLLRANYQARVAGYASALQNGWMSRNEVRALEDLPGIDGGDAFTVQLNLVPVDELPGGNAAKPPAKEPA